jgi:DNA-binding NarL/FixJ family response regulator
MSKIRILLIEDHELTRIGITPLAPSSEPKIEAYPQESSPNQEYIDASTLTERELEVLHLIVEGCSNALIARRLHITVGTVKNHVRNVMSKLSASDPTQAAVHALRSGLVV